MPIFARWRRIERLPPARGRDPMPGVYEIADDSKRTIYVGQSGRDVPGRIRQHLTSAGCVGQHAAWWRMRESRVPQADEADLLASYRERHGELPRCNDATPLRRDAARRWRERSRG